jgi:hypothetical protein
MKIVEVNQAHTRLYLYEDEVLKKEYVLLKSKPMENDWHAILFSDPQDNPVSGMAKIQAALVQFDENGSLSRFVEKLSPQQWQYMHELWREYEHER